MKILPIIFNPKLKRAFNLRKDEFHCRLASDPLTSAIKVRQLKNGSTVFIRYSDKYGTANPFATDVFMFRPNASIESKSYHYIRESNASDSKIGEVITKNFFKNNSYAPYKTDIRTIWK